MRRNFVVAAAALAAVFTAGELTAQASRTQGGMAGVRLVGSVLTVDGETHQGAGLGFIVGIGFNPAVALYLNVDGVVLDGGLDNLWNVELGVRYTFGTNAQALRPFVNAGVGGAVLRFTEESQRVDMRGPGGTVGAGLNYFFTPGVALDAAFQLSAGRFDNLLIDGRAFRMDEHEPFTISRLQLGVVLRY
jgi:hypothetical protein